MFHIENSLRRAEHFKLSRIVRFTGINYEIMKDKHLEGKALIRAVCPPSSTDAADSGQKIILEINKRKAAPIKYPMTKKEH